MVDDREKEFTQMWDRLIAEDVPKVIQVEVIYLLQRLRSDLRAIDRIDQIAARIDAGFDRVIDSLTVVQDALRRMSEQSTDRDRGPPPPKMGD